MKKLAVLFLLFIAIPALAQEDQRMSTYSELLKEANARIVNLSAALADAQKKLSEAEKKADKK